MHKLGRYGILIAVAFLALANVRQSEVAGRDGQRVAERGASPLSPTPIYSPYAGYDPDPCYHAAQHDTADLCAQWRAAIAAETAAHEARRATNWAIVATMLSAAGLAFIVWSLWQTEGALGEARQGNRIAMKAQARATRQAVSGSADTAKALKLAEENAKIAAEHAGIAQKTATLQLRAYLALADAKIKRVPARDRDGALAFDNTLILRNAGSTPALDVRLRWQRFTGAEFKADFSWLADREWYLAGMIAQRNKNLIIDDFYIAREDMHLLKNSTHLHHLLVELEYSDVYETRYRTRIALWTDFYGHKPEWIITSTHEERVEAEE